MKRIAIFASGSGSNAENIANFFIFNREFQIELILTNNPKAGVLERADRLGLESKIINRHDFYQSTELLDELIDRKVDLIVLAGFLWLVPLNLIQSFSQKIINIHPALLPKYGGKGMYGNHVHQSVSNSGDTETGITIHYVNENYDEGDFVFQKSVEIEAGEDPEQIAQKVHALEYTHFPMIIDQLLFNDK